MRDQLQENLNYFGRDYELLVVYEELSELTKAITKFERGITKNNKSIIEEAAHVKLCLEYTKLIFGFTDEDMDAEVARKLRQLKKHREQNPK